MNKIHTKIKMTPFDSLKCALSIFILAKPVLFTES